MYSVRIRIYVRAFCKNSGVPLCSKRKERKARRNPCLRLLSASVEPVPGGLGAAHLYLVHPVMVHEHLAHWYLVVLRSLDG